MTAFDIVERPAKKTGSALGPVLSPLCVAVIETVTSGDAVKLHRDLAEAATYHGRIGATLRRKGLRLRTRTMQDTVYLWAVKAP